MLLVLGVMLPVISHITEIYSHDTYPQPHEMKWEAMITDVLPLISQCRKLQKAGNYRIIVFISKRKDRAIIRFLSAEGKIVLL